MLSTRIVSQRALVGISRIASNRGAMNFHLGPFLPTRASPIVRIAKRAPPRGITPTRPQQRGYGNYRSFNPDNVVIGLVGVNVSITLLWMTAETPQARGRLMQHFTTSPGHLAHHHYHTLLTNVFSHADPMHLLTNMIGLYFFGREISRLLGPKRFLGLYLASGVLSSYVAVKEQQLARRASLNLGASGAVNAITTLSILLFPNATLLFFGIVPVPAWIAGSMFIGRDLYGWLKGETSGIGHVAHLIGAACGGLYYAYLRRMMRMYR